MKKTKLSLAVAGLMLVGAIVVTSCKKTTTTTTTTPDTNTTSATDNNMAQLAAHDITNIGSQGIENDNGTLSTYRQAQGQGSIFSALSGSVTVVFDTTAKTMMVTFSNYFGLDGHLRNGTLVYDWSASSNGAKWFRDAGFEVNVSTPGSTYSVDGYKVEITQKTITNLGAVNGNYTWTDLSKITIVKPNNAGYILWQGNWTITLLNTSSYTYPGNGYTYNGVYPGSGSPYSFIDWVHAIISISGTFNGTASDGETYTGNISAPLVLNLNCGSPAPTLSKYLYVAGTLNFTPTGKTTRTIDYGTGTCDLTYTITIGTYSFTITLP